MNNYMYNYNHNQNRNQNRNHNKNKNNNRNNRSFVNTDAIYTQLNKHIIERVKLQQKQDALWSLIKRGYKREAEMNAVDKSIGDNTYAIDNLIGKLISVKCRSGRAYSMAVKYLKGEIARNQRIISSWVEKIRDVECGRSCWIRPDGSRDYDCTFAYRYVANKKQKTAALQRRLSQLI